MILIHLYVYSFSEKGVDSFEGMANLYKVVDQFSVQCDEKKENIRIDWTLKITHPVSKESMLLDIFDVERTDDGWNCAVIPTHEACQEYSLH
ncbi:hypothetical protein JXR01_03525 [Candidatus Kaiserbacteria bacterium]|nr:MAG: hypothetical protein JXR01_03525 [Candidatus Kaiserbacteria bacterium]